MLIKKLLCATSWLIISVIYAYESNSQILIASVDSADALAYGNARKLVVSRDGESGVFVF